MYCSPQPFIQPAFSFLQVLSLQHSGSKDSSQYQFASYWKPILSMDANFWQRWLHMHRIAIILHHDMWGLGLKLQIQKSICRHFAKLADKDKKIKMGYLKEQKK